MASPNEKKGYPHMAMLVYILLYVQFLYAKENNICFILIRSSHNTRNSIQSVVQWVWVKLESLALAKCTDAENFIQIYM